MDVVLQPLKQLGLLNISDKLLGFIGRITYIDLIILAVVGLVVFYYGKRQLDFFASRGIKHFPYKIPLIGNMMSTILQQDHLMDYVERLYTTFPDQKYVGHMSFTRPLIMVRDLDVLRQIGIKSFDNFVNHEVTIDESWDSFFGSHLFALKGDKWRDMRATLSPAFTSSKMRNMFEFITEIGQQMTEYYLNQINKPENQGRGLLEIEMKDAFTRYTNDVIATSAFGIKTNSLEERENEFFRMSKKSSTLTGIEQLKFFLVANFPRVMTVTPFDETVKEYYRSLVLNTMARREEQGIVRQDMIHLLMKARKNVLEHEQEEDKDAGFATVQESNVGKSKHTRSWSDDDIAAQAFLFLVAGFDTSSTLLCLMAHELTLNQDVQEKLQEEIDEIGGGNLTYNALINMKYMDMVVSETLRLWPPAAVTDRQCLRPFELPPVDSTKKHGYTLQPGEGIWIPIYGLHRDPQYFPNPTKFDPERFSDENKDKIVPLSYIPFGIGPRNCIGSRFALLEVKAIMFHMLANFNFVKIPRTDDPIEFKKDSFGMRAKNGFWIGLKPRTTK